MSERFLPVLFLFIAFTAQAQQRVFTREDSLRGSITPERSWWDLNYYHLNIKVVPEKKWIEGDVTIRYKVVEAKNTLQVDLQPPLTIQKITQDNVELTYRKDGNNAYMVDLKKQQKPGSYEAVVVHYSGNPIEAKRPPWDGGFQFIKDENGNDFVATSCQGLGASAWWPNKDHMYDEADSMLISITVPEKLMDVSNGRLRRSVVNNDGTKTFDWFVSNPINNYGVNVNIATYEHFSDTLHGEKGVLNLEYYVLPYNMEKAKKQFQQVKLMLRAFEYWFGPYPFYEDSYKLVEVPYLGMEHQSSVTYGNGFENGYRGRDLSGTGWGLKWDFIIIHESGHEWFANNITYKDIADMWIHESFTNYSESLFTEYYYGKDAGIDYVFGTRAGIKNDIPIVGPYNVNENGSGDMYPKGGNMLNTIRSCINDDVMWRNILRGLNKTFYHQTVTTKQIEDYISKTSGINFGKVFDQYLRTTKIPQLEYYVKGKKMYYRWANCVDGFDLMLKLKPGSSPEVLRPTPKWQKIKITSSDNPIDTKYIERMYYVNVVQSNQ